MTNEETKKKKTGITPSNPVAKEATDNTAGLIKTAKGILGDVSKAAGGVMSGSVTEAIKAAGETDLEDKITQVKESSEETRRLLEEAKQQQAGESAVIEPEEEPEDGLQRMIREAQIQTDRLAEPKGMVGGDVNLAGAGQKLLTNTAPKSAGVPMEQGSEEEEPWVDTSYLTPQAQLMEQGKTMQGAYVDPKAGTYYQQQLPDGSYETTDWLHERDGSIIHTEGMSEREIRELIRKAQDDSFQLTGRVYGLQPDGTTPKWLSVGDQVVTAGGTYVITGYNKNDTQNPYHSMLLDPNQTTENFTGHYNTGTYGSIIGEQNGYQDDFMGYRYNGENNNAGGYSRNGQTGQMQFDTVSHTYDGNWTRTAIVEGVPYEVDAAGNLTPLEAGSIVQDATNRYWVVGADGSMIDVTPSDPSIDARENASGIMLEEAKKAGIPQKRAQEEARRARNAPLDPVTQAQIRQMQAQFNREKAATEAANRELYRQYRLGQESLNEQLVGSGLQTTGASERAHADLTGDWISAMNANQQQLADAEDDVAYQIQMARLQAQQEAQQKQQQEAQQKAATLAQYGDFSGYSELGYSPAQIAGMQSAYDRQNAPDTTYGGLSDYTVTLLELYQANPNYDIRAGLQQALDSGLISQQDYLAGLQMAAGLAV